MNQYAGSAMISNTQLYEVDALLKNSDRDENGLYEAFAPLRVFDLITLIEAIVLNDKLFTLPATIKNTGGPFIQALIREGIVEKLDTSAIETDIGKVLLSKLEGIKKMEYPGGYTRSLSLGDEIIRDIRNFYYPGTTPASSPRRNQCLTDSDRTFYFTTADRVLLADDFEEMARKLIGWMDWDDSGEYDGGSTILRDLYYIYAAEHLHLPYYPHFNRIAFARDCPNYYDVNFKTKLYDTIAKELKATIEEVYEDFQDKSAFIPPFSSLVLNRCSSPADITGVVLELRSEFEGTRKGFTNLELEKRESKNLKERLKITRQQQKLLESAARMFDHTSEINLAKSIKYIPELIKPATAPHDPTKYSADLLLQPIGFIMDWWRKRPIGKMFSLKYKILEIKEYHHLVKNLFAVDIDWWNFRQ